MILYTLRSGVLFYARPRSYDIFIANEVFAIREYERKKYDVVIRPQDVILDVGAFIGDFTIYAAHKARKGFVYAVEPLPSNIVLLKDNVTLNSLTNTSLHCCGIAGEDGTRMLHGCSASSGAWSLFCPMQKYENKLKVLPVSQQQSIAIQLYTIKTFLQDNSVRNLNYVKLDCEGAEYEAILSLPDSLLRSIRCCVIELHPFFAIPKLTEMKEQLIEKFRKNNFLIHEEVKDRTTSLAMLYCRNKSIV